MTKIRFTSPSIEQIEFKKVSNFKEVKKDIALNVDVQHTEPVPLSETEFYYGLKITISGEESPFSLSIQLAASFELEAEDSSDVKKILETKGTEILYSYARPIITDIVVKAGLPPLTIPYVN